MTNKTNAPAAETKVITGKVRLSYAHLFTPKAAPGSTEAKYSVSLIIPKSDKKTLSNIRRAIENATQNGIASKWGGKLPRNLKTPLRDGDDERPDDPTYANSYFINATSKTAPGLVDQRRQPIISEEDLYSGAYAFVSVNFYPFDTNGSKGIACGLNNVMKAADGDFLGGRASADEDFKDIEVDEDEDDALN
ncbi:MAG: DUF2815 domain-containing protein [Firmicutes bacterium HGW-Firmicutes-11]|jgi:hypothetical protein|nr:MAG: DUF2815 domain-containing protein [Firmicutes bacterium HGW-Firmicutes-19]PKM84485.1 MAG: DUF2815 domain-containing protein [Firmicutes bacterium HGW-Firmicutes-11]